MILVDTSVWVEYLRNTVPVLHADGDFDAMARYTDLKVVPLSQ